MKLLLLNLSGFGLIEMHPQQPKIKMMVNHIQKNELILGKYETKNTVFGI